MEEKKKIDKVRLVVWSIMGIILLVVLFAIASNNCKRLPESVCKFSLICKTKNIQTSSCPICHDVVYKDICTPRL